MAAVTTKPKRSARRSARPSVEDNLVLAMRRLLEQGQSFTQVSVERLAAEAGISRATFYLHFRDKSELVARLLQQGAREVVQAARLPAPEQLQREELRESVRGVVNVYRANFAVLAAVVETASHDVQVATMYRQMVENLAEEYRRALDRMQKAGRVPAGVPSAAADVVVWAFERACYQMIHRRRPNQINDLVDGLTHVIWTSLYSAPAKP